MKLKNKHLLIILAIIILIIAIVYMANRKKMAGDIPTSLIPFKSDEIVSIQVIPEHRDNQAFTVKKINGKWYILYKKQKMLADSSFMDRTLAEIDKLIPSMLVSEDQESWKNYGVDSSGTLLRLTSAKGENVSLIIGNMTFQNDIYVSSYLRKENETRVYAAECYMEGTVKASMDAWREKKMTQPLFSLNYIQIQSDFIQEKTIQLKKEGNEWKIGQNKADTSVVNQLIRQFSAINDLPLAKHDASPPKNPEILITLDYVQRLKTDLSFYPYQNQYLIGSSVNEGNYLQADSVFVNRLKNLMIKF